MKSYEQYTKKELIEKIVKLEYELTNFKPVSKTENSKGNRHSTHRDNLLHDLYIANLRLRETGKAAKIGQWTLNVATGIVTYYGDAKGLFKRYKDISMPIADYYKYIHPMDLNKVINYMSGEDKSSKNLEYRLLREKKTVYFRSQIIRIREANGERIIEGYVQNIDDMIKERNELEIVKNAVNMSNDVIVGARFDGRLVFANRLYRKYSGIPSNANISDYYLPTTDIQKNTPRNWSQIIDGLKRKRSYKYTIERLDHLGKKQYFGGTSYIIKDDLGEDTIWCFWKNITKQTIAENQTNITNRLLNAIFENIPASIFVKDSANDFRYVYVNKVARYSSIFTENVDPINKTDDELFPPEMVKRYRDEDTCIMQTKGAIRKINNYTDSYDAVRTMDTLKLMVEREDEDSALIIGIGWDITDIKKIEAELIEAKEKAEQSDKLKSAFLSNMSHEIRTPLNAILGFSRIISETNDAEERKKYYSIVEANNTRLLSLINEILDLSRIESGAVEFVSQDFNLNELMQELYDNLSLLCIDTVKLVLDKRDGNLWIKSDRNRLYQVISNLITNAQKFTKEGEIRFGYKLEKGILQFFVKDTGIGIPEDNMATIFDRFVKVNSTAVGTGLGLAICKTIVNKLGGEISATSVFGEGTNFFFTLPYDQVENPQVIEIMPSKPVKRKRTETKNTVLLIVEDLEVNFRLINAMIGKDYTLLHAVDGEEALDMFKKYSPDLVLLDIRKPLPEGLDFIEEMIEYDSEIPIVALSAYAYEDDINKAKDLGLTEFLIKPINKVTLMETLSKYI